MRARKFEIRQIFSTNSQPTIEVELQTAKGTVRSSVPIGTSTSKHEVKYLQAEAAVRKFNLIKRHFTSEDFVDLEDVDSVIKIVDKTDDFREIGGNLVLAISSAFLKAFALEAGQELFVYLANLSKQEPKIPRPICNTVGGGKHSGSSDIQEFLLLPVHQKSFFDSIKKISQAYLTLGSRISELDPTFSFSKNIESAWTTNLQLEEILNILSRVANENLLKIGLDFAASQLWDKNEFYIYNNPSRILNTLEQIKFIKDLAKSYPIYYFEDPFHEDDFTSFGVLTHELDGKIVCGDDLYSTNTKRLKDGLDFKATNAVIIKPNQIGTITDVLKFFGLAKKNRMICIASHRSGETEDNLICHLAVGLGCDYIKLGISGERTTKINEMIRIEEKLTK